MSILDDTHCQLCEGLITKEQCNKHLFSSRHLHRKVNGYWSAFFPQRKLTRHERSILEKNFWKKNLGSEDVSPVYGFLKTYNMMVTIMKDYVKDADDGEDENKDDFG